MKNIVAVLFLIGLFTTNSNAANASLLFYGNCTACHMDIGKKSAPTFIEIKEHYKRAYPAKNDFVKALSSWVFNPNEETSIMQDAVKKYKLMPQLTYDLKVLEEIAAHIYEKKLVN